MSPVPSTTPSRWALLVYRLLLRLYPAEVRRQFADDMTELFAHQLQSERVRKQRGALWRQLGRTARDLALSLPAAWRPTPTPAPDHSTRPTRRSWLGPLVADLRFALRGLRRHPGFAALAISTLALGIGANSAVFSVLDAVLLQPLPYRDSERIVRVLPRNWLSARQVDALQERLQGVDSIAGFAQASLTLTGDGEPQELSGTVASAGAFEVFATSPALGRIFNAQEQAPGGEATAILGHRFWRERFGADPEVLGRQLQLGGEGSATRTVIGVLPAGFEPVPWSTDVLVPMQSAQDSHDYADMVRYWGLAKLAPGVGVGEARAELRQVVAQLAAPEEGVFNDGADRSADLVTYLESRIGSVRPRLLLLLAAVAVVLLIGCSNVANLLLARSSARRNEIAVRTSLGASQPRLVRQLLTESTVLAGLGGVVGLGLGWIWLRVMALGLAQRLPRGGEIGLDLRVVGFTLLLSVLSGALFGLAPALRSAHMAPGLREQSRSATGGRRSAGLHRSLVAFEVALCVILVATAGLLTKSFWHLHQVSPGFEPRGVVALRIAPPASRYGAEEERRSLYRALEERLRGLPGVEAVGAINLLPLSAGHMGVGISPDGEPLADNAEPLMVSYRAITRDYPGVVGMPLLEGRALQSADRQGAEPVGLINRALARRLFPDRSAVGEQIAWGTGETWLTVVGVVGDVHQHSLATAPVAEVYVPYEQESWLSALSVLVRSNDELPEALLSAAVWEVDPQLPLSQITLEEVAARSMADAGFYANLFALFAALAVTLAAVGIYGVLSYVVSQRRQEIGIRLAIGASARGVLIEVLRTGMSAVGAGLAVGLVGAWLIGDLLADRVGAMLFQVEPHDPLVLAAVAIALSGVAFAACVLPAWRAARLDPVRTLAEE